MNNLNLISLGVLLVVVAVSLLIFSVNIIVWQEIIPLVVALYGSWMIVLAVIRRKTPSKYERGPFSTFAWGLLLTVIGFSSISYIRGILDILYIVAALLLVLGILAIAVAIEKKF
jgi:hypothetical protein